MTVTTADVAAALVGTVVPTGNGQGSTDVPGYEDTTLPVNNGDGTYTINATHLGDPTANEGALTFAAYTFADGTPGISYTLGGATLYFQVVAFNATQVLLQQYVGGVKAAAGHYLLTDGGTVEALGQTFPIQLATTGSSYTTPSGTVITGAPVCFGRGTLIATLDGDVAVEDIREGDLVITVSGEAKPVTWVGARSINVARHPRPENVRPVCVTRSAFAPNVPSRDLVLSPDHNVFVEGVLIPAKCLVNGRNVVTQDVDHVEYFHVELAAHDVVYANGLEAETYLDAGNRAFFAGNGVTVAHPDFASIPDQNYFAWEANGYARLVLEGAEVERTRARLAERATELANRPSLRRSA